ncbi:hypothetical protein QBC41DRAFT_379227 [Cercophora samala]|uniref:Uncharacterized protein n=1 Tax=Cercophora samala TaxID=330535 RepID=A0AA40D9I4_9PEZI|nr:hypothetical protein QBC41DRAFT_379227 [Cercophora samala]
MAAFLLIWAFVLACFASAQPAPPPAGWRYWIDPDCVTHDADFESYPLEVFYLARSAYKRLKDPADTDFKRIFWVLFKTKFDDATLYDYPTDYTAVYGPKKGTAYDIALDALNHLATQWSNTTNRAEATVRIHCDNQERFQSYNGLNNDVVWDTLDQRTIYSPGGIPACQRINGLVAQVTRGAPHEFGDKPWCTMDFCNAIWTTLEKLDGIINNGQSPAYRPRRLDKVQHLTAKQENVDFRVVSMQGIGYAIYPAYVLMHEMFHTPPYFMMDYFDVMPNSATGGWEYALRLTTAQALTCAETYEYPHGGFTFDRRWEQQPDDLKWTATQIPDPQMTNGVYYNPIVFGALHSYGDITGEKNRRDYEWNP